MRGKRIDSVKAEENRREFVCPIFLSFFQGLKTVNRFERKKRKGKEEFSARAHQSPRHFLRRTQAGRQGGTTNGGLKGVLKTSNSGHVPSFSRRAQVLNKGNTACICVYVCVLTREREREVEEGLPLHVHSH